MIKIPEILLIFLRQNPSPPPSFKTLKGHKKNEDEKETQNDGGIYKEFL